MTQVGACPHCGAPIYSETIWQGVTPPPVTYSCECRTIVIRTPNTPACNHHCFCQIVHMTTGTPGHRVCCKCGDRIAMTGTYCVSSDGDNTVMVRDSASKGCACEGFCGCSVDL